MRIRDIFNWKSPKDLTVIWKKGHKLALIRGSWPDPKNADAYECHYAIGQIDASGLPIDEGLFLAADDVRSLADALSNAIKSGEVKTAISAVEYDALVRRRQMFLQEYENRSRRFGAGR